MQWKNSVIWKFKSSQTLSSGGFTNEDNRRVRWSVNVGCDKKADSIFVNKYSGQTTPF